MRESLLDRFDRAYQHAQREFMGACRTGAYREDWDVWLTHCGFPQTVFNAAHPKRPGERTEELLEAARAFFEPKGLPWCVRVREDHAPRVAEALAARAFERTDALPVMSLDLGAHRAPPPPEGLEVVRVRSDAELEAFGRVAFLGFGFPEAGAPLFLTPPLRDVPGVELLLGLVDGEPVCTSALVAWEDVAGIYWVATLEGHRGRGLGEALTWAAVEAGRDRGATWANLQASVMGRPVYERMGFETPTHYVGFEAP